MYYPFAVGLDAAVTTVDASGIDSEDQHYFETGAAFLPKTLGHKIIGYIEVSVNILNIVMIFQQLH